MPLGARGHTQTSPGARRWSFGAGSIGLDVAVRLAATGITRIGIMDFDTVEERNLDRLIGATALDARLHRSKVELAGQLVVLNATAAELQMKIFDLSICEPAGLAHALDYDLAFSCVDRPWARAVLNTLAYAHLVPVIDGGISVNAFADGEGMRGATWRSHVVRPGRPCLACNGQLDLAAVTAEQAGDLDDPHYIAGLGADGDVGERRSPVGQRRRRATRPVRQPQRGTRRAGRPRAAALRAEHAHARARRHHPPAHLPGRGRHRRR